MGQQSPFNWREFSLPLGLILLMGLLQLSPPELHQLLRYDRAALEAGQWWRAVSGHFVHLNFKHWAFNSLALLLIVALAPNYWLSKKTSHVFLTLIAITLLSSLMLYFFQIKLNWYVGLSGILHGLFFYAAMSLYHQQRLLSIGLLFTLLLKLVFEYTHGPSESSEALLGGKIIVIAHLYGALSALVIYFLVRSFTYFKKSSLLK